MDLDELVEKVAGEDRRDPYKELAKNPSSLVRATTILVIVAQRTLSGPTFWTFWTSDQRPLSRGVWAALSRPIWI